MAESERTLTFAVRGRSRTVYLDMRPLKSNFSFSMGSSSTRKLRESFLDCLVIKPNWKQRLAGVILLALAGTLGLGAGLFFLGWFRETWAVGGTSWEWPSESSAG